MELNTLRPARGAKRARKRIGRGPGSGTGKTAGRGHKGQKSRSGYSRRYGFEGGQMPLVRRIPKRGFTNIFRVEYQIVNVGELAKAYRSGSVVSVETMAKKGLVREGHGPVKILANGDLGKKLTVRANKFSESARAKIETAGGTCEVVAP